MATGVDGARLDAPQVSQAAALAALDLGTLPLVLVRQRAVIVHANKAAEALFAAKRTFQSVGGRLVVHRQTDQTAIEDAIGKTVTGGKATILRLTNRQGDINQVVNVSPSPDVGLAVLTFAELGTPMLLQRNWSREALLLPTSHAELAEAMALGENLAEFAERTGLTIGGTRSRLKKLLRRLNARSQADLVAILVRTAAAMTIR